MVQHIITPWRDRNELLAVRAALHPRREAQPRREALTAADAVGLVSIWMRRGQCPHLVESSALLVAVELGDTPGCPAYAARAAYATAFCRFVTGLLDGFQTAAHKQAMYTLARAAGLPASFVELRHQCIHEELPALSTLRAAAHRALAWIWDRYWAVLDGGRLHGALDQGVFDQGALDQGALDADRGRPRRKRRAKRVDAHDVLLECVEWRAGQDAVSAGAAVRGKRWASMLAGVGAREAIDALMDIADHASAPVVVEAINLAGALIEGATFAQAIGHAGLATAEAQGKPKPAKEASVGRARLGSLPAETSTETSTEEQRATAMPGMVSGFTNPEGEREAESEPTVQERAVESEPTVQERAIESEPTVQERIEQTEEDQDDAWSEWTGPWTPMPMGMVDAS